MRKKRPVDDELESLAADARSEDGLADSRSSVIMRRAMLSQYGAALNIDIEETFAELNFPPTYAPIALYAEAKSKLDALKTILRSRIDNIKQFNPQTLEEHEKKSEQLKNINTVIIETKKIVDMIIARDKTPDDLKTAVAEYRKNILSLPVGAKIIVATCTFLATLLAAVIGLTIGAIAGSFLPSPVFPIVGASTLALTFGAPTAVVTAKYTSRLFKNPTIQACESFTQEVEEIIKLKEEARGDDSSCGSTIMDWIPDRIKCF